MNVDMLLAGSAPDSFLGPLSITKDRNKQLVLARPAT